MRLPSLSRRDAVSAALLCASCSAPTRPSLATIPAFLPDRCKEEIAINGAYVNQCMSDAERTFQWPSPVGAVTIEQGGIGPSNTGETLWNAAVLMADHMATTLGTDYFTGKRVLELGCGTALPSIVASRCGAERVVATDIAPEVLARAKRNVARNGRVASASAPSNDATSSASHSAGTPIELRRYVWGSTTDAEAEAMEGSFDVVLASDVLWVLGSWKPLADAARQMLAPGGDFLLAETGHDSLPLPAALAGFRTVAESSGLVVDDARTVPLPLQIDGFDAQLLVAHKDARWGRLRGA